MISEYIRYFLYLSISFFDIVANTSPYLLIKSLIRSGICFSFKYSSSVCLFTFLDKNFDDGEHKVVWNGDKVSIVVHEKVNGVFSSLFGFSTFDVVSQYQGSVIEGKKRIEKVK